MFKLTRHWGKQQANWFKAYWECLCEGRNHSLISTKKQFELEF